MKKYKNVFILLLVLTISILTTSVFAQVNSNIQYTDNATEDPIDPIGPGVQDLVEPVFDKPIDPTIKTEAFKKGEPAACFDYYTFGSINVSLQTDLIKYDSGSPIFINGQITNNNRYPITNLSIRARLVRDIPNPEYLRSEIITVSDFNVVENITINASSTFNVQYSHLLPLNAPEGKYKILFYAYNNDRFNQAGLSFTNDIIASSVSFDVMGGNPHHIYLDQTKITLNDQVHNVMAFLTQHEKDTPVTISIPLVNPSSEDEEMTVVYTLYKWDGLRKENIVDAKTETIFVPAKNKVQLTYTTSKTDASVYFLNIKADNTKLKKDKSVYNIETQSNIRFAMNGYDFPRINSFGVDSYPIRAGQEATLFTCYHNGANQDTINPVNISTILYDEKGKVVAQTEYDGKIGGDINAIIKKFTLKKDLVNFKTITTLTDNTGNVLDTIENEYKCEDLDPTQCSKKGSINILGMLGFLVVLILIGISIMILQKRHKIPMVIFVFMIVGLGVSGEKVEAASVTDTYGIDGQSCSVPAKCDPTKFIARGLESSYISHTVYKNVFLVNESGNNLPMYFSLDPDRIVNLRNEETTGSWFFAYSIYDSPPADGLWYTANGAKAVAGTGMLIASVSKPFDVVLPKVTSNNSNIVECINNECKAKNPGTTTIEISFPRVAQTKTNGGVFNGEPLGFGRTTAGVRDVYMNLSYIAKTYSFPPVIYTVTVPGTINTPHTSTCTGATGITTNSATVNWSYSDIDNDPQTQYMVQLSRKSYTDPTFATSTDVLFATSGTGGGTSHTFSGLVSNTTYYSRIRTYNQVNGWSLYSICSSSFTTSTVGAQSCSCNGTRDLTCTNPTAPVVTNSPACAFNAVCDILTLSSGNTNFRIIPDKSLGSIRYERVGGSPVTLPNTQSYTHSTTTIAVGSQSITVRAIDLYDNSEVTRTCVYNSNTTPPSPANINLSKTPLVTMNRGSDCTLYWEITDMPEDAVCTLTSKGVISLQNGFSKDSYSEKLNSNKKFTLTCLGGTLSKPVSRNTICRINPEIREN